MASGPGDSLALAGGRTCCPGPAAQPLAGGASVPSSRPRLHVLGAQPCGNELCGLFLLACTCRHVTVSHRHTQQTVPSAHARGHSNSSHGVWRPSGEAPTPLSPHPCSLPSRLWGLRHRNQKWPVPGGPGQTLAFGLLQVQDLWEGTERGVHQQVSRARALPCVPCAASLHFSCPLSDKEPRRGLACAPQLGALSPQPGLPNAVCRGSSSVVDGSRCHAPVFGPVTCLSAPIPWSPRPRGVRPLLAAGCPADTKWVSAGACNRVREGRLTRLSCHGCDISAQPQTSPVQPSGSSRWPTVSSGCRDGWLVGEGGFWETVVVLHRGPGLPRACMLVPELREQRQVRRRRHGEGRVQGAVSSPGLRQSPVRGSLGNFRAMLC